MMSTLRGNGYGARFLMEWRVAVPDLCCGYRGSNRDLLKDCWAYDISGNYWTQCADLPDEASGRHKAAAFALNGKGYVTTGSIKDEPYYLADTWEYDPATDTWLQKDDFAGGCVTGHWGLP